MAMNYTMQAKVLDGDAINIADRPREGTYYILDRFIEDVDYCDLKEGVWVWSIGRRRSDGKILATTDSGFYQNPLFECLWLR